MPTPGLSLVGFMDQQQAINHLRNDCVPADPSDAALVLEWTSAKAKLGGPIPNAGTPDIQDIPAAYAGHIQQIIDGWTKEGFGGWPGTTFKFIEIDPLLAYQFAIDADRSDHHCGAFSNPPKPEELMPVCLPLAPQLENIQSVRAPQSLIIRARSLNVQLRDQGMLAPNAIGITFGVSVPYTHVVRHNGRCYLHNGFHRAYGARLAGATHIPCVFRDVPDHASVGLRPGTFQASLLESVNPPTMAHFTQGRAYDVRVKIKSRVLHVSWAEYVVPEE